MSAGYFSRLLQRARGETSGIRPVVAPLYAPGLTNPEELREIEQVKSAQTRPSPAGESQTQIQTAASSPPPGSAIVPPPQARVQAQPETPARASGQRAEPEPTTPPAIPTSRTRQAEPAAGKPPEETNTPLLPLTAPAQPGLIQTNPALTPQNEPQAPTAREIRVEKLLLPIQPAASHVIQPGAPEKPAVRESKEAPAPAVKISIGRIEVRAVQPPAPTPAPRTEPHPAMSLDEYLRRLNEENQ